MSVVIVSMPLGRLEIEQRPLTLSGDMDLFLAMGEREQSREFESQLRELTQHFGKLEKRVDDLESLVASIRSRLDKVQSQLSGERQIRKWLPKI